MPTRSRRCIFCAHEARFTRINAEFGACTACFRGQRYNPQCTDCGADGMGMGLWQRQGRCIMCHERFAARGSHVASQRTMIMPDFTQAEMRIAAQAAAIQLCPMCGRDVGEEVGCDACERRRMDRLRYPLDYQRELGRSADLVTTIHVDSLNQGPMEFKVLKKKGDRNAVVKKAVLATQPPPSRFNRKDVL